MEGEVNKKVRSPLEYMVAVVFSSLKAKERVVKALKKSEESVGRTVAGILEAAFPTGGEEGGQV